MPHASFDADIDPTPFLDPEFIQYLEDREFDLIFPDDVQKFSRVHWTPISVARQAARFLVTKPQTRVLDIGCGPGKFCAIGATTTEGHFTGVEQRESLVRAGLQMIRSYGLPRVNLIHANMTEISFADFDAFYFFNPFAENLWYTARMDFEVEVSPEIYNQYTAHVKQELSKLREGTRVVTYWSDGDEMPECYELVGATFSDHLKMWVKGPGDDMLATSEKAASPMGLDYITTSAFASL
jgi:SAM-dependent methyltransferase